MRRAFNSVCSIGRKAPPCAGLARKRIASSIAKRCKPRSFAFNIYGEDAGTITRDNATGRYTVDPDGVGAAPSFSFNDRDFNRRSLRGNAVVRWEYRPGSALFFVWQQSRFGSIADPEFDFSRDFDALWSTQPENVFVVKGTWWIGR